MKIRCFYPNKDDRIEFTREELEKLINDVYDEGREDGERLSKNYITIPNPVTTPYTPTWYNTPTYPNYTTIWCSSDNSIGRCVLERESPTVIGG